MARPLLLIALVLLACDDGETTAQCDKPEDCGSCQLCSAGRCEVDPAQLNPCGVCGETPKEECGDGLDNDCDGMVDEGCFTGGDPCLTLVCASPPEPECVEGALRTWVSPGTCNDGECSYSSSDEPCDHGCKDGACGQDPCFGIICNTAPSVCWKLPGTCADGKCSYEPNDGAVCTDADPCTVSDLCVGGSCVGLPQACDDPPADVCISETTLRVYVDKGACEADGSCFYEYQHVTCDLGCLDGACKGDPCTGVECKDAPGPCWTNPGACTGGSCSYSPLTGDACDDGDACTELDECTNGVCAGAPKVCNTPPAPVCADGSTVRAWSTNGTCAGGQCTYTPKDTPCKDGCEGGACITDPCEEVTCGDPPSVCLGGEGTCVAGVCSYAPVDGGECDDGDPCTEGDVCGGGLCAGTSVPCDAPPAPECVDASSLRSWGAPGTCSGGECSYVSSEVPCTFGCEAGACKGDPCAGVACNIPPDACHSPTGFCSGGICTYGLLPGAPCNDGDPCTVGDTCSAKGQCSGSPKCTNAPAGTCFDTWTLYAPDPNGACQPNGSCQYTYTLINCPGGCDPVQNKCAPP
ncbi:MAG: hypothetical protein AMXMBFR64_61430 [Myxococcales bacterium]